MSSFALKILAILTMTIDHIGFLLFPQLTWLRAIGRLAFPIFAFQIGIGFRNTKNKKKYIVRMLLFAIISQIPYHLALQAAIPGYPIRINIGATLTCGLLALYCLENINKKWLKYVFTTFIILLGTYIHMDYGSLGILMIIVLYYFEIDKIFSTIFYIVVVISDCLIDNSTFSIPQIFALIPMFLYNGKKGKNIKYLFYAYYPLHLIILVLLKKFAI